MRSFKLNLVKVLAILFVVTTLTVGCNSESKPSKEALVDHFVELVRDEGGFSDLVPKSTLEKIFQCLVDGIYDDTSAETLNKMLELETIDSEAEYPVELKSDEKQVFDKAQEKCDEELSEELQIDFSE